MKPTAHVAHALSAVVVLGVLAASAASAAPASVTAVAPAREKRANFDAFLASRETAERAASLKGASGQLRGATDRAQWERRLGVPTFNWVAGRLAGKTAATRPEDAARAALAELAESYKLDASDAAAAIVTNVHDTGRGPIVVTFKTRVDGIEVFRERAAVALSRDLKPFAISGYLSPRRSAEGGARGFALSPGAAAAAAFSDLRGEAVSSALFAGGARPVPAARPGVKRTAQGWQDLGLASIASAKALTPEPIRYRPVFYRMPDGLHAAYNLEIWEPAGDSTELWSYVISARDGSLLNRTRRQQDDDFAYNVWAEPTAPRSFLPGPTEDFAPRPTDVPDQSAPAYIPQSLVSLQNGPISTNDPWLAPSATVTTGNNVEAYADLALPDGFTAGDLRADTTSSNTFDYLYDTALQPDASQTQRKAAVTQLFYTVNMLHDLFYDHGFDEASGNAQTDNFGRGGLGNDSIRAEAQDSAGFNNANMSTPLDGGRPRMQMYVFLPHIDRSLSVDGGSPYRNLGFTLFGPENFDVSAPADFVASPCTAASYVSGHIALSNFNACNAADQIAAATTGGAAALIWIDTANPARFFSGSLATNLPVLVLSAPNGLAVKALLPAPMAVQRTTFGVRRDGSLDGTIVAHEWGHYFHHRLSDAGNEQGGAMSEGWGDFMSMLITVKEGDNPAGVYSMGGYATPYFSDDNYYFGIRRMPYSTQQTVNPLTLRHISEGEPISGVPIRFGADGNGNSEVHSAGEVWTSMLWEAYASLLPAPGDPSPRLTFDEAHSRMLDYAVAGLKLMPPDATYVEARDAMLAAAGANDAADYLAFCNAFARRGAGTGAVAPDRASVFFEGVVESFECGGDLALVSATLDDSLSSCDNDGMLDRNERGLLHVTLKNVGNFALSGTTLTVTSPHASIGFPQGNTVAVPPSAILTTMDVSVPVSFGNGTGIQDLAFELSFDDPLLAPAGPRVAEVHFSGNTDDVPAQAESFEARTFPWTTTEPLNPWTKAGDHAGRYAHGPDSAFLSDTSLVSPVLEVAASGSFEFTFKHRFDFEYDGTRWDGGVLEISVNGGPWTDIAAPGYNGTVTTISSNPIGGRLAYTAQSAGYPAFATETIDLGTAYQGQQVQIRFRLGSDLAAGAAGWDVDDVVFTGISNTPFTAVVGELPKSCVQAFITVTAPDTANQSWQIGSVKAIRFIHNLGKSKPVLVEINRDYPAGSWATIGTPNTSAAGSSTFNWTVTGPLTTKARVRVTSAADSAVKDVGNADFSITPRVKVTAPNTAANWKIGATKAIKWSHNFGVGAHFSVGLDRDGDAVCETTLAADVTAAAAANGSFDWKVKAPATVGATAHVCVTPLSSPSDADVSDVGFTIKP